MLVMASSMRLQILDLQRRLLQLERQSKFLRTIWLSILQSFGANDYHSDVAGGAFDQEHDESQSEFSNACLAIALRRLGFAVNIDTNGPFWAIKDGNRMLSPFDHMHSSHWSLRAL